MALAPSAKRSSTSNRLTRPHLRRQWPVLPAPAGARDRRLELPAAPPGVGPRYCALFLAGFPAWAAARLQPELQEKPFAVVWRGEIAALSPQAHELGVEQTWSVARMQSLHPEVEVRPRHPAQETVAWDRVMAHLARLSPCVESVRPGLALLDLPEPRDMCPLLGRLHAQGGAAYDRSSAELAAHSAKRGGMIRLLPGGTVGFLQHVSLAALSAVGVSEESIERLGWFGWKSIGDLRGLTRHHLESQFPEGALIYRYARAEDTRPIAQYRPEPKLMARLAFEEPVREPAQWQGALNCLLVDLTSALGESKVYSITLCLETTQGRRQERYFLRQATDSRRTLSAAAERMLLALLDKDAELQAIRIVLGGLVMHRSPQTSLFETRQQAAHAELAETLHSLEARYPGMVRRVIVNLPDAYLPEERFEWEALSSWDITREADAPSRTGVKPSRRGSRMRTFCG